MAELFENVEVNRESRRGVMLRLLSGSILLHLALLWLVVYVPAFRDALNIASIIANTRFVEKPYDATVIGDDVELLELAKPKFHYPDGYWADPNLVAQAGSTPAQQDPFAPQVISRAEDNREEPVASPSPSPSPSPLMSPLPSPAIAVASPGPTGNANVADLNPDEAQKKLEQTAAENNIELPAENEINRKVLKDFATYANDLKNQGKLDFNKPFEIVIEAELDENGKLKNAHITKKAGDENLVDLFGRMIAALNDSGLLIYLKPIKSDNPSAKIVFTIKQGENEVVALVESEAKSSDSARILAKALNGSLVLGALSRKGKDEAEIMKNTNVAPDGRRILINFSMPRQSLADMIKKQLEQPGI